jgi:rhodanese-related sulfurtransferase
VTTARSTLGQAALLLCIGTMLSLLRGAVLAEPALLHPRVVLSVLKEQAPLFSWTPAQLRDADDVVLVDGRTVEEYAALHPAGALPMPSQQRDRALVDLWPRLRGRRVAVVAGSEEIAAARDLAAFLVRHAGVEEAGTVRGGWEGWRDAGLPCSAGGS